MVAASPFSPDHETMLLVVCSSTPCFGGVFARLSFRWSPVLGWRDKENGTGVWKFQQMPEFARTVVRERAMVSGQVRAYCYENKGLTGPSSVPDASAEQQVDQFA